MSLYKLENLKRVHGSRTVLEIESLKIAPQKIYTLIGPNGAGKTSLLKILSFLDRPTEGRLFFKDQPVTLTDKKLHEIRREVVLLDQNPIMFTGSVWKNIEFGLRVRKIAPPERHNRIEEALELVGLEKFAHYDAKGLSGGESKRVALARALVLRPTVLLCDEPTANVDQENQEIILKIVKRVNSKENTSVIFSTHYLSQGQRLADHTLLLQHGRLSDLVNENIFKVTIPSRNKESLICQITGQLYFKLPSEHLPPDVTRAKLHIDPKQVVFEPELHDESLGTPQKGHVMELSHQSGEVRLLVDIGVRLEVHVDMEQYRLLKPGIGDKVNLFIPFNSIKFSSHL